MVNETNNKMVEWSYVTPSQEGENRYHKDEELRNDYLCILSLLIKNMNLFYRAF